MPYLILFFAFFFSQALLAQEPPVERSYLIPNVSREGQDTLRLRQEDNTMYLYYRDSLILEDFSFDLAPARISQLSAWGEEYLFLIGAYAGDGCPTIHRILCFSSEKDGEFFLSEQIGNCNSIGAMSYEWPYFYIEFPELGEVGEPFYRAPERWKFHIGELLLQRVE